MHSLGTTNFASMWFYNDVGPLNDSSIPVTHG